jgi:membrane protein required for colicin V production
MSAIILGLLASLFFYKNGGEFLREQFWPDLKVIPEVVAFIALFVIVFMVIKLLELMLKGIIERIQLSGADRFLGVIFGFAEGLVVVSLILFLLQVQPLFDAAAILSESSFARLLLPFITGQENITSV